MSSLSESLLQDFLLYLRAEKGLSSNTLAAYERDIRVFLAQHSSPFCSQQLISHLSDLRKRQYASASIARALIALKVFFRFLYREKKCERDLSKNFDTPKLWQRIPEVLSQKEIDKLLRMPNPATYRGARDKAILEVLYACGIRVSELCGLTLYSLTEESVKVLGKGGKERIVPIGQKALQAVDHYLAHFRDAFGPVESLFLSSRGKPMDRIAVWKMVKQYARLAGIRKPISPHTFRHSFATHLVENGGDLRIVQEMLGHAHIATTDRYTQLSLSHLQAAFFKHHPRK